MTPFCAFRNYESRLTAKNSWQEDYEEHGEMKETAFAGANSQKNRGRCPDPCRRR